MGSNINHTRRSQRLNNRWVTLPTGFPPGHPRNRDRTVLVHDFRRKAPSRYARRFPNLVGSDYSDISADISLQRNSGDTVITNRLSDLSLNMSNEERFNTIETEVSALKTDVGTINEKLDKLIESMASLTTKDSTPAPATPESLEASSDGHLGAPKTHSATHTVHSDESHRPGAGVSARNTHHHVGRHLSAEEFFQREMDWDKFEFTANGRYQYSSDYNNACVMAKSCICLARAYFLLSIN